MKVTFLRIWVDFTVAGKAHTWYWDKRFENYTDSPVFTENYILECVQKQLKLDVSKMIDNIDNFGNPEYNFEGYEQYIERKYMLKLNPEKMEDGDTKRVLLAINGIKTKTLNPKKVPWALLQDNYRPDELINPLEFDFPQEMLSYLNNSSNLFKSITAGLEGPTMIELRSAANLKLIDLEFWADEEHIKITKSFFNNDPNKGNDEKLYQVQAIDLIRENDLYQSEGLLIWIPKLKIFGTFDAEHNNLVVFPDAKVKDIQKNFGIYIMAQWSYGKDYLVKCGNIYDYYEPWKYFNFE
jgi:hypothetical protein